MFFTKEDIDNIEKALQCRSVKDTDLHSSDYVNPEDLIAIVQNLHNRKITLSTLLAKINSQTPEGFYVLDKPYISLEEAISRVPSEKRKLGIVITFRNEDGFWRSYQFYGENLEQDWTDSNNWKSAPYEELKDFIPIPDEQDLTSINKNGRTAFRLKDREPLMEETQVITLGKKYLRGRMTENEPVVILTQSMVSDSTPTHYIIQGEFDLAGATVEFPNNSILEFDQGVINNGTLNLRLVEIRGIHNIKEAGNASLEWLPKSGQIMTFDETISEETVGVLKMFVADVEHLEWIAIASTEDFNLLRTWITRRLSEIDTSIQNLQNGLNAIQSITEVELNNILI